MELTSEEITMIPKIGVDAFAIYIFLRSYIDVTGCSQPSYSEIEVGTGLNRHIISRSINILISANLVQKRKRFSKSCVYLISSAYSALPVVQNKTTYSPVVQNMHTTTSLIKDSVLGCINNTTALMDEPPAELTQFQIISTKFMNLTHIPERFDPRWVESVNKLVGMGVTEEILTQAIEELGTKYNLAGPWSVINACANVMRKNGHSEEPRPKTDEERIAEMNAEILRKVGLG
jgi:hypothetical protein